jgi:hypothetical protein
MCYAELVECCVSSLDGNNNKMAAHVHCEVTSERFQASIKNDKGDGAGGAECPSVAVILKRQGTY